MKKLKHFVGLPATAFLLPIAAMIIVFGAGKFYPFGDISNLIHDLDIQYVDYFAWFKHVLEGDAGIAYSFSKSLGGPLVALYGYYLVNPLNLLVVFFSYENIPAFIFLLSTLKLGLCGLTSSIYFRYRFKRLSGWWVLLLSFAYAMMQYNMTQLSNIMWLDGVIMLPLVMIGVYRCVKSKKYGMFYLMTGLNIVLNWYTGYMVCLFTVFYFLYEELLWVRSYNIKNVKIIATDFIRICFVEGMGVLLSGALFYPVMVGLSNGKQVFDISIFELDTHASFIRMFRGFVLGSIGDMDSLSLYCGLLFLLLIIFFFVTKKVEKQEKVITGLFLGWMLASCWLTPLECLWSGLRHVWSYYCRFSFLVIFLLLVIGARAVEELEVKKDAGTFVKIAGGCILVFMMFDYVESFNVKQLIISVIILLLYIMVVSLPFSACVATLLLGIILIGEIICNSWLDFGQIYYHDSGIYSAYVRDANAQSQAIKEYDGSPFYRVEQTAARDNAETKCTAFFSESMAYDYNGVSQYSSAYDRSASDFIAKLGYSDSVDITIYDETILPSDTLLGVKYVASKSPDEVYGYRKLEELGTYNEKNIYYNPYALSLGYRTDTAVLKSIEEDNPFEFQNQLYSNILGREVEIFKSAEWMAEKIDNQLKITIPAGIKGNLYGYMRANAEELPLYVDGKYRCQYQCWLSYQTFNLGSAEIDHTAVFENFWDQPENAEIQFYVLDHDVFEKAVKELQENQMEVTEFSDGYVTGNYSAQQEEKILLTVPYDENWEIRVNDEIVIQEKGADALTVISVNKGDNQIEMEYHVHGVKQGIMLSAVSLLLWLAFVILEKRKMWKGKEEIANEKD